MSACCGHDHGGIKPTDPSVRRVLWFALVVNAVMFIVEMTAGLSGKSVSLQADAVDFFGDAVSYGLSLAVLSMPMIQRTRVAALKGIVMGLFGLWVVGNIGYHLANGTVPSAPIMGGIGLLAMVANIVCALMLFRFRGEDANLRSVWVCSRNDALSNIAVVIAASGVWVTNSGIPDLIVAALIGGLALYGSFEVLRMVRREYRDLAVDGIG